MSAVELIAFILISVGIGHLWSFSEFFSKSRNFIAKIPYVRKPLICPECSSFWSGIFLSFFYNPFGLSILSIIYCGIISYICCVITYKVLAKLEIKLF
jgi:hypothetical protein